MTLITSLDQQLIWHPYTQHGLADSFPAVVRAQGAYLELEDGSRLLDAVSSWWVNLLGHSHPKIVQAIQEQSQKLDHVIFAGFTHEPATRLAEKLISYTKAKGSSLSRVFYSDNGSTAVEAALKMAFQFHKNRGDLKRTRFLALRNSYHGDTFGAMAVGEPEGFHPCFRPLLAPVDFIDLNNLKETYSLLRDHSDSYCALILEPLVQGAGGMRMYSPEILDEITKLCKKGGILVIYDEVFTGFSRTGTTFAFEQSRSQPDLLCLSKGITGGTLPLAVTLATEEVFLSFKSSKLSEAFLHGHSYTANPIACAAAVATWEELQQPTTQEKIQKICEITKRETENLSHSQIQSTRSLGTIGVIELKGNGYFSECAARIRKESLQRGILLRPLGNVVYCIPPYCITEKELVGVYTALGDILNLI